MAACMTHRLPAAARALALRGVPGELRQRRSDGSVHIIPRHENLVGALVHRAAPSWPGNLGGQAVTLGCRDPRPLLFLLALRVQRRRPVPI